MKRLLTSLSLLAALAAPAAAADTVKIGIALSQPGELDPLLLMARADRSLLEAKRAGKKTYRLAA